MCDGRMQGSDSGWSKSSKSDLDSKKWVGITFPYFWATNRHHLLFVRKITVFRQYCQIWNLHVCKFLCTPVLVCRGSWQSKLADSESGDILCSLSGFIGSIWKAWKGENVYPPPPLQYATVTLSDVLFLEPPPGLDWHLHGWSPVWARVRFVFSFIWVRVLHFPQILNLAETRCLTLHSTFLLSLSLKSYFDRISSGSQFLASHIQMHYPLVILAVKPVYFSWDENLE